MTYHVYILYSKKFDRSYVGVTTNPVKRLHQHNNKEAPFTARGVPWVSVWQTKKESRQQAETLEQKIKNLSRHRKIQFMLKYEEGIQDSELLESLQ